MIAPAVPASPDDPSVQAFAQALFACFDQADADVALRGFRDEARKAADLAGRAGMPGGPHPLVGVAAMLVSRAMLRSGRGTDVLPFLAELAARAYDGPREPTPAECLDTLTARYAGLWIPLIEAAVMQGRIVEAAGMLVRFHRDTRTGRPPWLRDDPWHIAIERDARAAPFGPFFYDAAWALRQQEAVEARDAGHPVLDRRRETVRQFEALFLQNALVCGEPARALPLMDRRLPDYLEGPIADGEHFGFNAGCVLAGLGRYDEALAVARAQARRGYGLMWRYNLAGAARMAWTQAMRQNEYLGPLAETDAYRSFLRDEVIAAPPDLQDPAQVPLAFAEYGVLGGKARKRCFVSRRFIEPGQPIVRLRCLFGTRCADRLEIAARDAFDGSGWAASLAALETDAIPLPLLFPPPGRFRPTLGSPAIAAFWHDVGRDPDGLDLGRAARLIADHAPPPIRHEWVKGGMPGHRELAFEPFGGDAGHGDAPNLVWRLVKAGLEKPLLERCAALPQAKADKVFAMLATFGFDSLRRAAADHFGLPDLPSTMETVFKTRPSLADHLALADFGAQHLRFRKGLAAAMRDYALPLYSNCHPGVDWYLQGLTQYALARGCHLLFFLIHHPEDDAVLATMLETGWLPNSVGSGAYDAYGNSRPFFVRTVALHLALHAPGRLDAFLGRDWIARWCDTSRDRETFRLVKSLSQPARRRRAGAPDPS